MEVSKEVKEGLMQNLKAWRRDYVGAIDHFLWRMEKAGTVEELMLTKQELLRYLVSALPLGTASCYFCIGSYLFLDCYECPYAVHHKPCSREGSDWKRIMQARDVLLAAIGRYYCGEQYDDSGEERVEEAE